MSESDDRKADLARREVQALRAAYAFVVVLGVAAIAVFHEWAVAVTVTVGVVGIGGVVMGLRRLTRGGKRQSAR